MFIINRRRNFDMSETTVAPSQSGAPASRSSAPGAPARPSQAAMPSQAEGGKKYDYVRVKLFLPGTTGTTISLDRELVQQAVQALGSEQKVKALAASAALEYVKGVHPARSRSAHAARALRLRIGTSQAQPA